MVTPSQAWENGTKLRKCSHQSVCHLGIVRLVQDAAKGESTHGCHTPSIRRITCGFVECSECSESAFVVRARATRFRSFWCGRQHDKRKRFPATFSSGF